MPDGALVTVAFGRTATFKGEDEPRYFRIAGDGVRVAGGKFSASATADDPVLLNLVQQNAHDRAEGLQPTFGPLLSVAEDVIVCAQIRTTDADQAAQPPDVMAAIGGASGAGFKSSPNAMKFGDQTWLEAVSTTRFVSPRMAQLSRLEAHPVTVHPETSPFCPA